MTGDASRSAVEEQRRLRRDTLEQLGVVPYAYRFERTHTFDPEPSPPK